MIVLAWLCGAADAQTARYARAGSTITVSTPGGLVDLMNPAFGAPPENAWSAAIVLTADIDMVNQPLIPGAPDVSPDASGNVTPGATIAGSQIGNDAIAFTGTFNGLSNGKRHTIKNLTIVGASGEAANGLFGVVNRLGGPGTAAIQNVILENVTVYGNDAVNVGALVGTLTGGTIWRCSVRGTSSVIGAGAACHYVGGLGGTVTGLTAGVSECYSTCNVSGPDDVGGLVGFLSGGFIANCYVERALVMRLGAWNALSPEPDLGCLVGHSTSGTGPALVNSCYTNCPNPISLAGNAPVPFVGGLAGYATTAATMWGPATSFSGDNNATLPSAIGGPTAANFAFAAAVTPTVLRNKNTYIGAGWNLNLWYIADGGVDTPRLIGNP
jgi:hypothetical protein